MRLDWLALSRNERVSKTISEANEREQKIYAPLMGCIAMLFGQPEATLEALEKGADRLSKGEQIMCSGCGRSIWSKGGGHAPACEIVLSYLETRRRALPEVLYSTTVKS